MNLTKGREKKELGEDAMPITTFGFRLEVFRPEVFRSEVLSSVLPSNSLREKGRWREKTAEYYTEGGRFCCASWRENWRGNSLWRRCLLAFTVLFARYNRGCLSILRRLALSMIPQNETDISQGRETVAFDHNIIKILY